ncbi:MAG: hypothetical protein E7262_09050 [Lachnospiraceae bacterium]|nr:hypothetical protein [Lachnospiraceae bacterium]
MKKNIFIVLLCIMSFSFSMDAYAAYPAKYSAVSRGYVTAPKNQGGYGTCYAFSAISAIETNLLKNKKVAKTIDLSEYHLVYSLFKEQGYNIKNVASYGMQPEEVHRFLTGGMNITTESKIGYSLVKKGTTPSATALDSGTVVVKNAYRISYSKDNVKGFIGKYGSAIVAAHVRGLYFDTKIKNYNCTVENDKLIDHSFVIVGWDDNYSRNNFKYKPKNNGAWLCKNSGGNSAIKEGYFWMSYESKSVYDTIYAYEADISSGYYSTYKYDSNKSNLAMKNVRVQTNIYTAKQDELLTNVMMYVEDVRCNYNIYYYPGDVTTEEVADYKDKSTLLKSGTTYYRGYYTVDVAKTILLSKGQEYSIIVEMTNYIGNKATFAYSSSTDVNNKSYVVYEDEDKWKDIASDSYTCKIRVGTKRAMETAFTRYSARTVIVTANTTAHIAKKKYLFRIENAAGKVYLNTGCVNSNRLVWQPTVKGTYIVKVYCKDLNTGKLYGRAKYYTFK